MTKSREKYFSVKEEIAVHPELPHGAAVPEEPPVSSVKASQGPGDYYSSVAFEPGQSRVHSSVGIPLAGQSYSMSRAVLLTIICGLAGGVLAIPALFLRGNESGIGLWMLVVFGPFAEETLKQSGMIFQLEKLPGTVRRGWQFFLVALLGATVFSVLENLLYGHVYLREYPPERLAVLMQYRWVACTALHLCCTMLSALGLRRIWRTAREQGVPCQVSNAFPWFVMAMVLHGGYNLAMLLLQNWLFPK